MIQHLIKKFSSSVPSVKREVIPVADHPLRVEDLSPFALKVADDLRDAGYEAYIVGGCIRDALIGKEPKDFDVATNATPEQVKRLYRRARIVGRRFQIVHVQNRHETIEVTTFRGHHEDTKSSSSFGRGEPRAKKSGKGMLMRDNVFGSMEDDAVRRDFTCNALYFDTDTEEIIDFLGGVSDLRNGLLRTIGDPAKRFREDPVRMMRAIRFQAKLGITLDSESKKQMSRAAHLISEVSPARLFDEVIKLLLHADASEAYRLFHESGLFERLFPATYQEISHNNQLSRMLEIAMQHTEQRLGIGKGVSPFYLYSTLLWPSVEPKFKQLSSRAAKSKNVPASRAMTIAASEALEEQARQITIPKRFSLAMRDTWHLQTQLPRRNGQQAAKSLQHPKFRAGYDFLLMREQSGEEMNQLGEWWTKYQESNETEREKMVADLGEQKPNKRRRQRSGRGRRKAKPNDVK